jgi:hypothetical protein
VAIRITNFGGVFPKSEARALPDEGAQVAQDLQPGIREFRPLGQDTVVVANTGVSNPATIYRLARTAGGAFNTDMTTGWIVRAAQMSFVKAQINNDTTERTFATFDDGSAPPRVFDATDLVTGRQLGVPAPTDAPTLEVNVVAQFSTDDRASAIKAAEDQFKAMSIDPTMLAQVWRGAASTTESDFRPGTTTTGYIDRSIGFTTDADPSQQLRVFRLSTTGGANTGAISDTYDTAHDATYYQWVTDPTLGGFYKTSPTPTASWGTWASTNKDHWCVPFTAYAITFTPDGSAIETALAAMMMPGAETPTALFTNDQLTEVMTLLADNLEQKWEDGASYLQALKAEVNNMHILLGGGGIEQREASLAAFYAQGDVSDEIDDAVNNLAESLWAYAIQSNFYVESPAMPGG